MRLISISLGASFLLMTSAAFAEPTPKPKLNLKKAKSVKNIPLNANIKKAMPAGKRLTKPTAVNEKPLPPVKGVNGYIATVNGKGIKLSEFSEKYNRFTQTFKARKRPVPRKIDARYRDSIVKRLVEEELIAQEANRSKITIDPAELTKEFKQYKAMFKTEERFKSYLQNAKLNIEGIKTNLSKNLKLRLLLEKLGGKKVTDKEVRAYYDENDAKYKVREQIRARHILLKTAKDADPAKIAEVKAKADKIAAEAKKSNTDDAFAALAKKHSEGPTAPRGGDLSFFARNRMVKEFDEKAFSMKVGEVSDPVKTRFGWHVIRVVERKDPRTRPFDEVKESIERTLKNRANRTARQDLIEKLRAKAKVKIHLPK
mgnify:CR=1 FL=1